MPTRPNSSRSLKSSPSAANCSPPMCAATRRGSSPRSTNSLRSCARLAAPASCRICSRRDGRTGGPSPARWSGSNGRGQKASTSASTCIHIRPAAARSCNFCRPTLRRAERRAARPPRRSDRGRCAAPLGRRRRRRSPHAIQGLAHRLEQRAPMRDRSPALKRFEGRSMTDAARTLDVAPFDLLVRLVREDGGRTGIILFQLDEADVRCACAHRLHIFGSDGCRGPTPGLIHAPSARSRAPSGRWSARGGFLWRTRFAA